jgi:hypothetical protein
MPGFSPELLECATDRLRRVRHACLVRAYTSFAGGKMVCDWDAPDKEAVARAYVVLALPYDEIIAVEAVCEAGETGIDTRYL